MKLYFKNFEIYHNISIYSQLPPIQYFPGAAAEDLSHYVEESFWKRLWTCRLTDYWWCWWWPVILVRFYWNLNFLDRFSKKSPYVEFQGEKTPSCGGGRFVLCGRADLELLVAFRNFERAPKILRCAHTRFFIARERNMVFYHKQHELFGFIL